VARQNGAASDHCQQAQNPYSRVGVHMRWSPNGIWVFHFSVCSGENLTTGYDSPEELSTRINYKLRVFAGVHGRCTCSLTSCVGQIPTSMLR